MVRLTLASLLAVALSGCGGGASQAGSDPARRIASGSRQAPEGSVPLPLSATRFATVSDVFGPYVERRGDGALVAWAAASQAGQRSWSALALTERGEPMGEPVTLGSAPQEIGLVALRSLADSSNGAAFVLVDTASTAEGERIEVLGLSAQGRLSFGPTTLSSAAARFLWIGSAATAEGPLIFWAQKGTDRKRLEPAEIMVAALDGRGAPRSAPEVVMRDACAWQVASGTAAAALGVVRAHKQRCEAGPVELVRLTGLGKPLGAPVEVSPEPSAELDLDLVRVGERSLLAWTDRRGLERRVFAAAVDEAGRIAVAPGPAVPARGEQAMIGLVAPHDSSPRGYLVWEELADRPASGRLLEIAAIAGDARAGAQRARLEYAAVDGRVPEFQATARGVAALTLAPVCARGATCAGEVRPTFVEFDGELGVVASEPLSVDALRGKSVDLGWGLTCGQTTCFALSALGRSPTPLFATRLERRSDHYRPAAVQVRPGPPPRILESEAIAGAEPLAQVSVAELGGDLMIGWITDFDPTTPWQRLKRPAADGRFEPLRARIGLRPEAPAAGAPLLGPVQDLSLRAHSLGGIAIAPGDAAKGEALVAWAGIDNGVPQVFLTLVNKKGASLAQRMLTRKPGEVSDIALATVADGWLAGWVDERHGDAEVYVAKVNRTLARVGAEQRITQAGGAAADLALLPLGGAVLAVWTDARESQTPGAGDPYAALVSPKDGSRSHEARLFVTRPHSFAPALQALGSGALVGWLEGKTEDAAAGVYLGVLDAQAQWKSEPVLVPIEDGAPTALALDCRSDVCRALVNVDLGGPTELRGFVVRPGQTMRPARLAALGGLSAAAVSPVLLGNVAYYADLSPERQGRLRRARIEWE